jgi:integrase
MIILPNGCKCGKMSVFPNNWNTKEADLSLTWYIKYRFYSPGKDAYPVVIKGFAQYSTLADRRQAIKEVLEGEKEQLQNGYNPSEKKYSSPDLPDTVISQISPKTGFIPALQKAMQSSSCSDKTKADIKSVIKYIGQAATRLGFYNTAISDIKRKHIKLLLNECKNLKVVDAKGQSRPKLWNDNQYNNSIRYLSLLFTELLEWDAIDAHPIHKAIKKKQKHRKIRTVLTDEQCIQIETSLKESQYDFWRFMMIFFYSGGRITEMLSVKKGMVNINDQSFSVTIKKGKEIRDVEKPINDAVIGLWNEVLNSASDGEYLFSVGLKPGKRVIRPEQVTRRWKRHVKEKLNISADFYSLKHLFLDKVAKQNGIGTAQHAASHTTPVITMIYAINEKQRKQDALKSIPVKFGS